MVGEASAVGCVGERCPGRVQTPPAAVRGSPMPRDTPASAGGAPGLPLGHRCPQRRWRRGGVNNSPLTTSLTGLLHGAGAPVQLEGGRVGAGPKKHPLKGAKKGGDREKKAGAAAADPDCKGSGPKPGSKTATATFGQISRSWRWAGGWTMAPTPHLMPLSPPGPTKLICSPSSSSSSSSSPHSHEPAWLVSPSLRLKACGKESTLVAGARL